MLCARNQLEQRQPGEVRYYDYPQAPLLPSAFLPGSPLTPGPYAFMDFENILPVGGWLGSVVHLARFAVSLDGQRPPALLGRETVQSMVARTDRSLWVSDNTWYGLGIMGQTFPGLEVWTHSGGSQGSKSTFVRFSMGCSYALLLNGEGPNGGETFRAALAQTLSQECLYRRSWPSQDLFPQFLPPRATGIVNAGGQGGPVAPDSQVTLLGSELASAGAESFSLRVRDSTGAEHAVRLLSTSLTQVTFQLPAEVAPGEATLLVKREPHPEVTFPLQIE